MTFTLSGATTAAATKVMMGTSKGRDFDYMAALHCDRTPAVLTPRVDTT
jgi:hypothetical protein